MPTRSQLRRRRAALASGLVTVVAVPSVAILDSGDRHDRGAAKVPAVRLLGQRLVVGLHGTKPSRGLLQRARRGRIGGVVLFSENIRSPAQVATLARRLQRAAAAGGNPPLLIAVDQEGGEVSRFSAGPPSLSAAEMGSLAAASTYRQGLGTGRYLRRLGVNADLAPVVDVPTSPMSFIARQRRAFGSDPSRVAAHSSAFVRGLHDGGVLATAKHFPGLGSATRSTDDQLQSLRPSERELRDALVPYQGLARGRLDLVMMSVAAFPAYDPQATPAALSPSIYKLLREKVGFSGVTITDALEAPTGHSPTEAGVRAAAAGADLLLYAGSARRALRALATAANERRFTRSDMEHSYSRVLALKQQLK